MSLEGIARDYVRLAVALGERDPDALDYYTGPAEAVADIRNRTPKLTEIERGAQADLMALGTLPDGERRTFLQGQLKAVAARAEFLSGKQKGFDEESDNFFGVHPGAPDEQGDAAVLQSLDRKLPGAKSVGARYAAFDARFVIPEEKLTAVMAKALAVCRAATVAQMQLPAGESATVEFVRNKPWSAYSYYKGGHKSVIQVNADLPLTVDRALQLACHEGYPGHHAYNSLVDQNVAQAGKRIEFTVQPTFSPQSLVSEAAASVAIDIAFPGEERVAVERDVLFPLAGFDGREAARHVEMTRLVDSLGGEEVAVARDLIDGRLEFVRAATALEDRAAMAHGEGMVRYLNEFRTYAVTYTTGRDLMARWMDSQGGNRWQALGALTRNPSLFTNKVQH